MIETKLNTTTFTEKDTTSADFTVFFEIQLEKVLRDASEQSNHLEAIAPCLEVGTYNDCKNSIMLNFGKNLFNLLAGYGVSISNIELCPYSVVANKLTGERLNWATLSISLDNTSQIQFWKDEKNENVQNSGN